MATIRGQQVQWDDHGLPYLQVPSGTGTKVTYTPDGGVRMEGGGDRQIISWKDVDPSETDPRLKAYADSARGDATANASTSPGMFEHLFNGSSFPLPAKTGQDTLITLAKAAPMAMALPQIGNGAGGPSPSLGKQVTTTGLNAGVNAAVNAAMGNDATAQGGGSKTAAAMALIGGLLAGQLLKNNGANNVPPQLSQLLDLGVQRTAYQQPLFQAVNQGVHSMLPTFARQGTQLSGTLSNAIPAAPPPGAGGGMSGAELAAIIALATGGGVGLGGLMTGTNPYGAIADKIKQWFSGGGANPFTPSTPGTPLLPGNPGIPTFGGWDTTGDGS